MALNILFFALTAITLSVLVWSGFQLFQPNEDPLADRLDDLQRASGSTTTSRAPKRRFGNGFWDSVLYIVSAAGGEDFLRDVEKSLRQAGIRQREASAMYVTFNLIVIVVFVAG